MVRAGLTLIALLALAAMIGQPAFGSPPDDRKGVRGPGAIAVSAGAVLRPDDRDGVRGPGRGEVRESAASEGGGFHWRDAGVGLVGGIALALLAVGLAATAVQRHRPQRLA
jgi:hypothetical protein